MYKIIIDANILISAIFGGFPQKSVIYANNNIVFYSDKIELELKSLPQKLKSKLSIKQLFEFDRLIKELFIKGQFIKIKNSIDICRDKKDNHYLDLSYQSKADLLITGDKDLLEITNDELIKVGLINLKILPPKIFCKLFEIV